MRSRMREPIRCKQQEAEMLIKTGAALAAALVIGMTAPSMAGEGSAQITDWWNHDRGGAPYAFGWSGWHEPGFVYRRPGYAFGSPYVYRPRGFVYGYEPPVVVETDINTGYAPRRYWGPGW
jgi:hypothetical protein